MKRLSRHNRRQRGPDLATYRRSHKNWPLSCEGLNGEVWPDDRSSDGDLVTIGSIRGRLHEYSLKYKLSTVSGRPDRGGIILLPTATCHPQDTWIIAALHKEALTLSGWCQTETVQAQKPSTLANFDAHMGQNVYLCDKMCIFVTKCLSLWLQSALLCYPGSLELVCSWITPQCESPQVTSLAKSKCHYISRQLFFENL